MKKIFGTRYSKIGDILFSNPIFNYLESLYPGSYKTLGISKCCSQAAPLFINLKNIDNIHVLELNEDFGLNDKKLLESYDLVFPAKPQHPSGFPGTTEASCWWNHFDVYCESFRIGGFEANIYNKMPPNLQVPRLEKWFPIEKYPKIIALWGFAANGTENQRNPTLDWYQKLCNLIIGETEFKILRFGHPNEPDLPINDFIIDFRHLDFFSQIKMSLGCSLAINTDSGSGTALAAYGHKQINLIIINSPNHTQNLLAFAPKNCDNNGISLVGLNGPDSIRHEDVLAAIHQLK